MVGKIESIAKMSTQTPKISDEAMLSNGEKVVWETYLIQAARYLPKAKE